MNLLSWILLIAVLAGFAAAVAHIAKNKGGCSCGKGTSGCGQCGGCSLCGQDRNVRCKGDCPSGKAER